MKRPRRIRLFRSQLSVRGAALVMVLTLIVILSLIGIWGLTTSMSTMKIAGHYSKGLQVEEYAETAIRLAAQRLREIVDPNLTDSLSSRKLYLDPPRTLNWLIDSIAQEEACDPEDLVCPEVFDPSVGLDSIQCSVICNLMGTVVPEQVMLARKADLVEGATHNAIFLLTAVSRDSVGRRKVRFGVMTVPYVGEMGNREIPTGGEPRLVTAINSDF